MCVSKRSYIKRIIGYKAVDCIRRYNNNFGIDHTTYKIV